MKYCSIKFKMNLISKYQFNFFHTLRAGLRYIRTLKSV